MRKQIKSADGAITKAPKASRRSQGPELTHGEQLAIGALAPSIVCASVITPYQGNIVGKDIDVSALARGLRDTFDSVKGGDMSSLEAMLIGQANALQTIFASLARKAYAQDNLRVMEPLLGMALKAQAQSRATISALVDLKYPRQATFVKQANIANGPQQVNNSERPQIATHEQKLEPQQNELLEDLSHGSAEMDTRATPKAARGHQAVAAVVKVDRPQKHRR
jgi:hypothetical protein